MGLIPTVIPSKLLLISLLFSEIPGVGGRGWGGLQVANPVTHNHVDSPSGFAIIFILHENIHGTRVETLSARELDTTSKNNLREITLGITPAWPIIFRTLCSLIQGWSEEAKG